MVTFIHKFCHIHVHARLLLLCAHLQYETFIPRSMLTRRRQSGKYRSKTAAHRPNKANNTMKTHTTNTEALLTFQHRRAGN
mmetsp:Transcript_47138/g.121819  ORF Transcript_47138/g.121819 Transcript_47138/m.121819 type:complete len:81 (-) Transcript_47138:2019-2261(-)